MSNSFAMQFFSPWRVGANDTRVVCPETDYQVVRELNRVVGESGQRRRVLCGVEAELFEDWAGLLVDANMQTLFHVDPPQDEPGDFEGEILRVRRIRTLMMQDLRNRLFDLIDETPNLDWLFLTKRPESIERMLSRYAEIVDHYRANSASSAWMNRVWIGTGVSTQTEADDRIPALLKVPAAKRFLNIDPLMGPIDFGISTGICHCGIECDDHDLGSGHSPVEMRDSWLRGVDWVIISGDIGPDANPCNTASLRDIICQCREAGVPVWVDRLGSSITTRLDDGERWPGHSSPLSAVQFSGDGFGNYFVSGLQNPNGADPAEWPEDLRVRELPKGEK